MSDATLKQPKPTGKGAIVWSEVMTDMAERVKVGKDKYGTELRAFNGRQPLVDAYQEALDLTQYLKQAIMESRMGARIANLPTVQLLGVAHVLADAILVADAASEQMKLSAESIKKDVPLVSIHTLAGMMAEAIQEINDRRRVATDAG
jgi:hypothetical protein